MAELVSVQDGQVVSMDYTLKVVGEVIDASAENEPLQFVQGQGNIIPGLEKALYGMAIGESKNVTVAPEDGYGVIDPNAFVVIPSSQFPKDIPLEEGVELQVRGQDGHPMMARIESIESGSVRLNFNHPLAGKELNFEVKISALRQASTEEMDHGHVHDEHHHH